MYIGIDIGGTNMRLAGSDSLTNPRLLGTVRLPNLADYLQNRTQLITAIKAICPAIQGIGIGIAGELNDQKTAVVSSTHLSQWHNKFIASDLSQAFACPTTMIHDQACAALGEANYGQNVPDDFFLIGYGTGFGGAKVSRNGDQPVVQDIQGTVDYQLFREWEKACGGKSIELEFGKPAVELSEAEWQIIMDRFYVHLATFIYDQQPRNVLFGGGVAFKQAARLQNVFTRLKREHQELQHLQFALLSLGEDAALYGACALLRNTFPEI